MKKKTQDYFSFKKEGAKETCFGNWIDKGEDGADRNIHLKQQIAPCNELGCPSKFMLLICGQSPIFFKFS